MSDTREFPTVQRDGVTTHVLVPIEEFERLKGQRSSAPKGAPSREGIENAVRILNDPETEWHEAEGVLWDVLRDGIGRVRRERGLTQQQLAEALGVSQPQVSRLEANVDGATLDVLRRIAAVLLEHDARRKEAS